MRIPKFIEQSRREIKMVKKRSCKYKKTNWKVVGKSHQEQSNIVFHYKLESMKMCIQNQGLAKEAGSLHMLSEVLENQRLSPCVVEN